MGRKKEVRYKFEKKVGFDAKPIDPCASCFTNDWWPRPVKIGGGWLCSWCHPMPPGASRIPEWSESSERPPQKRLEQTWIDNALRPKGRRCDYCNWGYEVTGYLPSNNGRGPVRSFCIFHYSVFMPSDPFRIPYMVKGISLWKENHKEDIF